jgi:hypothetical protein
MTRLARVILITPPFFVFLSGCITRSSNSSTPKCAIGDVKLTPYVEVVKRTGEAKFCISMAGSNDSLGDEQLSTIVNKVTQVWHSVLTHDTIWLEDQTSPKKIKTIVSFDTDCASRFSVAMEKQNLSEEIAMVVAIDAKKQRNVPTKSPDRNTSFMLPMTQLSRLCFFVGPARLPPT